MVAASLPVPEQTSLLTVNDLHVYLGQSHVLQGVSFDVPDGGVTALLGRNGVGKTTTLRAILGLVGRRGSVRLGDEEISSTPTHKIVRRRVGYVPEDRDVFSGLTVDENLKLAERDPEPRYDLVYDLFPELKQRAPACGDALRRAAADARDRPRAAQRQPPAARRRADEGARARARRRCRPRARASRGADDGAARRAEPRGRAPARARRRRARPGTRRPRGRRAAAARAARPRAPPAQRDGRRQRSRHHAAGARDAARHGRQRRGGGPPREARPAPGGHA